MHRGTIGVGNLHLELRKTLNKAQTGIIHGSRTFKIGDKVLQRVNNYDKDVSNGDMGWISRINRDTGN
jgi:exodeoxyribonuclease V alpha subunit